MPFDLQPTLKGQRLELRPLREPDFDALYAVASDPLIWEQHPQRDRWKPEVFREFFSDAIASGGALVALDAASGSVVGSSRYFGYDAHRNQVEIGWTFLARERWGGVYNGEMKKLMIDHAFRFVDSVIFVIGEDNRRSRRAVEKLGGRLDADAVAPREGGRVVYRLWMGDWARRNAAKR
jgi:RimJ/RimL family protein N-acetyltransferase